ncbi:hypothetical protein D5S18_20650 [Nocardia panacis]|uniref:Ig-like domain repeat protein n=1 Tax=Nocardia panacis TaxID=2340916 RepID=A0A3A4KUQ8_9NOCA|nr:Ig-like domain repeat protein [Nocardia panacis]RJO73604.1 hypothetical protein D5S18_20650 [Nocardia panacis]
MGNRIAAACVLAAGLVLFAAPAAGADVVGIGVLPGINYGFGTNYGTGCTYTIRARVSDPVAPVTFYDNGSVLGTVRPSGGIALLDWVPAGIGMHTLSADQPADDPARTEVRVAEGRHVGYACAVFG